MSLSLRDRENSLFEDWIAKLPKYEQLRFICDGIFDEDKYVKSNIKTLFVLKDAYDNTTPEGEKLQLDIRDYGKTMAATPAWTTMAAWHYGIQSLNEEKATFEKAYKNAKNKKLEALSGAGLMNIKKVASHQATTDTKALSQHGNLYKEYIAKQWRLYKPDITICGSWRVFDPFCEALSIKNDVQVMRGMKYATYQHKGHTHFIIESCHPAAHTPAAMKYYSVIDLVSLLLNKQTTLTD